MGVVNLDLFPAKTWEVKNWGWKYIAKAKLVCLVGRLSPKGNVDAVFQKYRIDSVPLNKFFGGTKSTSAT